MKHLDLFSGIGGFALATEMVWDNVEHIFCDNEPFSQAILKKHWPDSIIYDDIKTLTADRILTDTRREYGSAWGNEGVETNTTKRASRITNTKRCCQIDLLTGGFPCQPFSAAGQRRGTDDDRHLWPEMLRVIREVHPRWIIGENVSGLLTWNGGMVLDEVFADLEAEDYEVWAFVIPACGVGAPHRRDRVWIVAHADSGTDGRNTREDGGAPKKERLQERDKMGKFGKSSTVRDAPDTYSTGLKRDRKGGTQIKRLSGLLNRERYSQGRDMWQRDWLKVATELCTLDDGLPNGLARPKGWRNAALKGAGNAIVPQVAAEIMQVIKRIDVV